MKIESIVVAGAGTMGRGIAQVSAQAGFNTILFDLNKHVLDDAGIFIKKQIGRLVEKGKLEEGIAQEILARIHFTSDISECKADFVIEAIVEKPEAKLSLFNQLATVNGADCIFATNTSSLSVTELAGSLQRPGNFIGMHFFNPAPVMKLVEIVTTAHTSKVTRQLTIELAGKMGKTPVVCRDSPGFIVNRVARPFYIESLRLVEEGLIDFGKLDDLLEATGFRMGPFRLMDLIGNDVNYAVSCSVYDQLGGPARLAPSDIQKRKVEEGRLGRKTGKGYYEY